MRSCLNGDCMIMCDREVDGMRQCYGKSKGSINYCFPTFLNLIIKSTDASLLFVVTSGNVYYNWFDIHKEIKVMVFKNKNKFIFSHK